MIDRSELVRLRKFQKISNSQVWLCLINKQDDPPVGHFWNTEKIWKYSFREKKEALQEKDRETHRYFEPLDPIELPYDWNIAPKVDLANGKSGANSLASRKEPPLPPLKRADLWIGILLVIVGAAGSWPPTRCTRRRGRSHISLILQKFQLFQWLAWLPLWFHR
jgi:hypothetical protein